MTAQTYSQIVAGRNRLSKIQIEEISLVDSPANPGARVAFFKSAAGNADDPEALLKAKAEDIRKVEPTLTYEQAYSRALDLNPALYTAFKKTHHQRANAVSAEMQGTDVTKSIGKTRAEINGMIEAVAKIEHPNDPIEIAVAKALSKDDGFAAVLYGAYRRAPTTVAVAKSDHYAAMQKRARELYPDVSEPQAFAKAFNDPEFARLYGMHQRYPMATTTVRKAASDTQLPSFVALQAMADEMATAMGMTKEAAFTRAMATPAGQALYARYTADKYKQARRDTADQMPTYAT
jgi:hypothetical protein